MSIPGTTKDELNRRKTIYPKFLKLDKIDPNRTFLFIDTPGDRKYIKNTIRGLSQADIALMVLKLDENFSLSSSDVNYSKMLAVCAQALGIKQMIVAVNLFFDNRKCYDKDTVMRQYSEDIKKKLGQQLGKLGFPSVVFVPIFGPNALNFTDSKDFVKRFSWVDSSYTLFSALNTLRTPQRTAALAKPFFMSVESFARLHSIGWVVNGKVETGEIATGDIVQLSTIDTRATVGSITYGQNNQCVEVAHAGACIGMQLKNLVLPNNASAAREFLKKIIGSGVISKIP